VLRPLTSPPPVPRPPSPPLKVARGQQFALFFCVLLVCCGVGGCAFSRRKKTARMDMYEAFAGPGDD